MSTSTRCLAAPDGRCATAIGRANCARRAAHAMGSRSSGSIAGRQAPTALRALEPGVHPVHLGDDGAPQGRGAVARRDARARRGRRSASWRFDRGRSDSLGVAARLSFRGHDRRVRAGRRAHPAVLRTRCRQPSSRRSGGCGASVLYASPLHFERIGALGPTGRLDEPAAGAVDQRADRARCHASASRRVRRPGGPGVRHHRGGAAVHQPGQRRPRGRRRSGRAVPGYEVAVLLRRRPPAAGAGVTGEIGVRGAGSSPRTTRPGALREDIARDGWFMTGDIGALRQRRRAPSRRPKEGGDLRRRDSSSSPRRSRRASTRFPGSGIARLRDVRTPPRPGAARRGRARRRRLRRWTRCARIARGALSPYKVPVEFTIVDGDPEDAGRKDPPATTGARRPPRIARDARRHRRRRPGGLRAGHPARAARRRGHAVRRRPAARSCSSASRSCRPSFPFLQRLGIEAGRRPAVGRVKPGVSFIWSATTASASPSRASRPSVLPYAYNIARPQFDEALVARAAAAGRRVACARARGWARCGRRGGARAGARRRDAGRPRRRSPVASRTSSSTRRAGRGTRPASSASPRDVGPRSDVAHFAHFEASSGPTSRPGRC